MNAKKPYGNGWRLSSVSRTVNMARPVCCWRKAVGRGELIVVSGIDEAIGHPAYRLSAHWDPGDGPMLKPTDQQARDILEDFQMLDAREQAEEEWAGIPGRGFFRFVREEARA